MVAPPPSRHAGSAALVPLRAPVAARPPVLRPETARWQWRRTGRGKARANGCAWMIVGEVEQGTSDYAAKHRDAAHARRASSREWTLTPPAFRKPSSATAP